MTPGGPHIETAPDQIAAVVLTSKYQLAVAELVRFQNSGLLPTKIGDAVRKLSDVVNNNTELMLLILNEKFREDFQFVTRASEYKTPYYGVVVSTYFNKFSPLKPPADNVVSETKVFLNIK